MSGIDRISALDKAFEFIYKSETNGSYCEFGVYQGVSATRALKTNLNWQTKTKRKHIEKFFLFDSFQGLPALTKNDQLIGYGVFNEGQFDDTSPTIVKEKIVSAGLPFENVAIFAGLFSKTLNEPALVSAMGDTKVAIAHIDCDLYSSAGDCLSFLDGRLTDGSIILFDDWFCYRGRPDHGVHKAFDEWCSQGKYYISDYFTYSWAGRAFIINTKT